MDAEDPRARGRGERRADGGAGGRLLRARLRHSVPRPAAQRGGRKRRARSTGFSLAAMALLAALCLARRRLSRPGDRRAVARRPNSPSARTCRASPPCPGCRSRRSRRAAARTTGCSWRSSSSCRRRWPRPSSTASPRARCRRAPAWDCGFPDPGADDAVQRRELQPADPPGVRPARLRGGGADRHAAPGRDARRASRSQAPRPDLERPLPAADPASSSGRRCSSTACSSSPSGST